MHSFFALGFRVQALRPDGQVAVETTDANGTRDWYIVVVQLMAMGLFFAWSAAKHLLG